MLPRKARHTLALVTLLALLATCSCATITQDTTLTRHKPHALPLPLLHFATPSTTDTTPDSSSPTPRAAPCLYANYTFPPQGHTSHYVHSTEDPSNNLRYTPSLSTHAALALKLCPLLFLESSDMALPLLSLLPLTPHTAFLMILTQLPTANAATLTPALTEAGGKLSSLLASVWVKYITRDEVSEESVAKTTVHSTLGHRTVQRDNKFVLQCLNVMGSITKTETFSAITDILETDVPDGFIATECGKGFSPEKLAFMHRKMDTTETDENKYLSNFHASLPYTIFTVQTDAEGERGGIAFFLHNKWKPRIIGKPTYDRKGRWISLDIRTPRGRTTIIAAYLPPSPQHSIVAKQAWANLQDYVISRHVKKRIVILGGDLNASWNNTQHRKNTGPSHTGQQRLLNLLTTHAGLTDAFPHCNPDSQYCTWKNHNTWTSPDHVLVSSHHSQHIAACEASNLYTILHGFDHSLITTAIDIAESISIPSEDRSAIHFDVSRADEYAEALEDQLRNIPASATPMERYRAFFQACIKAAKSLFTKTRRKPSKKSTQVLSMWNDLQATNTAIFHTKEGTDVPQKTLRRNIFSNCDMSIAALKTIRTQLQAKLHDKGRRRATLTRRLFTSRRSTWFRNNAMGAFLKSALSKYSDFRGVQSVIDPATGAVSSDPEPVKALATKRISTTFYKQRIPIPKYVADATKAAWRKMPRKFRRIFKNIKVGGVDPALRNSMSEVTPSELKFALKRMGKNKSGGPSGLTAEMLLHAPPAVQEQYLLPFVNECIKNRNTPDWSKKFNVWCIEKTQGVGTIMHPTNKLDVRPISLFEVSFKLVETILATRINDAIASKLHPAQHAFNSFRSVVDAIVTYTLVMEDSNQFHKQIHISNNDCTQAYDAVPPWAMHAVYKYHRFPPDLIEMLMNMDSDRIGRVLTAHGAGAEFSTDCGLGQGSVLAPLKWNLFLDPLLREMDNTSDPYVMTDGTNTVELRILAFADDTTIFASSHKGYLERMTLATTYFGYFGVNFSPAKTHYTYSNTGGRHYKSAPITVRHPDGSITTQHSSVTSPHKALRYLGAWLSPTLNWSTARNNLKDETDKILSILQHKSLTPNEFKYTIQSVLHSKLRYYLAVVPLTDKELDKIDANIATILKKRMHMASTVSSPLLFLPESDYGAELKSIKDTRATANIELAHTILNDNESSLGSIMRIRLSHLQDNLGWAHNPLSTPQLVPRNLWNGHWLARIAHMLDAQGSSIEDTHNTTDKPKKRVMDRSVHTSLPPTSLPSSRASRVKHNIHWLGQLTNPQGTKLISKTPSGDHKHSPWWKLLKANTCLAGTQDLITPLSPTTSPITRFVPTHNPGTVVTLPQRNTDGSWKHHSHNEYYKVTDSHISADGRETCYITSLHKYTSRTQTMTRGTEKRRVRQITGTPYFKDDNPDNATSEFADVLFPVHCDWVSLTPYGCFPLDVALIHDNCSVFARGITVTGRTSQQTIANSVQTVRDRQTDGNYTVPALLTHNVHYARTGELTSHVSDLTALPKPIVDAPPRP